MFGIILMDNEDDDKTPVSEEKIKELQKV